jgi:hypothetical protein
MWKNLINDKFIFRCELQSKSGCHRLSVTHTYYSSTIEPGVEQRAKGQKRSHAFGANPQISFRLEVFPSFYKSVCNSDQVAHEIAFIALNVVLSLLLAAQLLFRPNRSCF